MSSDGPLIPELRPSSSAPTSHRSKSDENQSSSISGDRLSIPGTPDPFDLYISAGVGPVRPEHPVESNPARHPVVISLAKEIVSGNNLRRVKTVSLFDALQLNRLNERTQSLGQDLGLESPDIKNAL